MKPNVQIGLYSSATADPSAVVLDQKHPTASCSEATLGAKEDALT